VSRYRVISSWDDETRFGSFVTQSAMIKDAVSGHTYVEGAFRVVNAQGKPAKIGKGGTVPFYGESAWSDAERLAQDLALAEAYAR